MKFNSIQQVQKQIAEGKTNCREVVKFYLSQIEKTRDLNAWVEVFEAEALERAAALDAKFSENPNAVGRLFGVVVSLKDNICYAGHRVTAASKILENFTAVFSATAVERLLAEDAIILGRTNCDQFGMGSSNENSIYGAVRNAADPSRVSGGSSGGAAVSVQSDTCLAAIGSDTGGSVRQPASFCGLWGLKPTYGRVSRHGLLAYGSSFDQIGCITRCPADAALLLEIMAGADEFDSTASQTPFVIQEESGSPQFLSSTKLKFEGKAKIAFFPKIMESEGLDEAVREQMSNFLKKMEAAGHEICPAEFDLLDYIIPAYYVLTTAEASTNLARYDGIRYGFRHPAATNLEEIYLLSRTEGFSQEVKRRILLGTFVLSSGYYDAYYSQAQRVRRLVQNRILEILSDCDFIVLPVAPSVAWRFGEANTDPVAMYLSDIFTVLANLAGVPALAFPTGLHPENGMPVGLQILGGFWSEERILTFSQLVVLEHG